MSVNEITSRAIEVAWMVFGDSIVDSELTGPERHALYDDIKLVCVEEEIILLEAASILFKRIGGAKNVRSYIDTLMVNKRG